MSANLKIEFMTSYQAGVPLMRCGGDDGCGSMVVDTDQHLKWHEKMFPYDAPMPKPGWSKPHVLGKD